MTDYLTLSTILSPLIAQFQPKSVLIVGETAQNCYKNDNKAQLQSLYSPFNINQLSEIEGIDLAIISEITDTLAKAEAIQWLGTLRNRHSPHIITISDTALSTEQGWQLSDYLALSMRQIEATEHHQVYSYAIENYQRSKDWLNSRFWANPEMYGKHRW